MEIFLSNYAIIYYLYSVDLPWWVGVIKFVFSHNPPFNFSKAFSDISNKSASHFDNIEWRWVEVNIALNRRAMDTLGQIFSRISRGK